MNIRLASIVTLIGQISVAALGLIGTSLLTHTIDKATFSSLQILISYAMLGCTFVGLGQVNTLHKYGPNKVNGANGLAYYFRAIILIFPMLLLFLTLLLVLDIAEIIELKAISEDSPVMWLLISCMTFGFITLALIDSALRANAKFKEQQLISVFTKFSAIIAAILYIWFDPRMTYVLWNISIALVALFFSFRILHVERNWPKTKDILFNVKTRFSFYLASIPFLIKGEVLVVFLASTEGYLVGAELRLALQFITLFLILLSIIANPSITKFVSEYNQGQLNSALEFFNLSCVFGIKLITPIFILFFIYGEALFGLVFGDEYRHISEISILLCLQPFFIMFLGPVNNVFIATGNAKGKIYSESLSAMVIIVGLFLLDITLLNIAWLLMTAYLVWNIVAIYYLARCGVDLLSTRTLLMRIITVAILSTVTYLIYLFVSYLFSNIYVQWALLSAIVSGWALFNFRYDKYLDFSVG